jgi:HEPN domain-containing protein
MLKIFGERAEVAEKIDLPKLVIQVDDELIQEGVEPSKRLSKAYLRIVRLLKPGSSSILQHDPLFNDVNRIYSELYPSDLHMPPMRHVGAFMFRDIFFPLRIPLIYGSPPINSIDFPTDVPNIPKRLLVDNQQTDLTFLDQVIDLMDFTYGLDDLKKRGKLPDKTVEWWYLAKHQLEAAAATVLGSPNKDAVIQNCCISTELLLKGALFAKGIDEGTLKNKGYGHNLEDLVNKASAHLSNLDQETLVFVVRQFPHYVESRYKAQNLSRSDLGKLLMNAQFISGEVLRQFSDRNFRADFTAIPNARLDLINRTFPKKQDNPSS